MEGSRAGHAPALLRVVGWLTILSGLLQIAAGVLLIVFRDDVLDKVHDYSSNELTAFAIGAIVLGLVYLVVGRGFLRLNSFALGLGLVVSTLGLAGDVIFLLSNDSNHSSVVSSIVVNVIVLLATGSGFAARGARR